MKRTGWRMHAHAWHALTVAALLYQALASIHNSHFIYVKSRATEVWYVKSRDTEG
jgi:hypothetical protein